MYTHERLPRQRPGHACRSRNRQSGSARHFFARRRSWCPTATCVASLHLARKFGVAISSSASSNRRLAMLRDLDPSPSLPHETDECLSLDGAVSAARQRRSQPCALRRYLQFEQGPLSPLSCRQAWTWRIAPACCCGYNMPQDALIQPWLNRRFGLGAPTHITDRSVPSVLFSVSPASRRQRAWLSRAKEQCQDVPAVRDGTCRPQAADRPPCISSASRKSANCTHRRLASRWLDVRVYHLNVLSS